MESNKIIMQLLTKGRETFSYEKLWGELYFMKTEKRSIQINGMKAILHLYFWENLDSVSPRLKRPMVVICPGGGYNHVSEREAEPVALKFMSMGFHACVLDYNVAPAVFPQALLELAGSVKEIREHAEEWDVDEKKIIICGFSAGGHLAGCLGMFWKEEWLTEKLETTSEMIQPNGMILSYPVITSGEFAHQGSFEVLTGKTMNPELLQKLSLEKQVTKQTPPVFLWHTYEDKTVPVENSLLFALELKKQNIPLEMHIFPYGPHGISLGDRETARFDHPDDIQLRCQEWPEMAGEWIKGL